MPLPDPVDGQNGAIAQDGTHPNTEGHRVLGSTIASALQVAGAVQPEADTVGCLSGSVQGLGQAEATVTDPYSG